MSHDSIPLPDLSHKENLDAIPPLPFVVSNNLKYIKIKTSSPKKEMYKPLLFFFREDGNFTHIFSIIITRKSIFSFFSLLDIKILDKTENKKLYI